MGESIFGIYCDSVCHQGNRADDPRLDQDSEFFGLLRKRKLKPRKPRVKAAKDVLICVDSDSGSPVLNDKGTGADTKLANISLYMELWNSSTFSFKDTNANMGFDICVCMNIFQRWNLKVNQD